VIFLSLILDTLLSKQHRVQSRHGIEAEKVREMITLNYLVRRQEAVSVSEFSSYWLDRHALGGLEVFPELGVRKYFKCETIHEDPVNHAVQEMYGTATDSYDFVDQMVIKDLDDFKNGLEEEHIREKLIALHNESSSYVDFRRSDYWFSVDVPQIFGRQPVLASPDNGIAKIFYVPRRFDQLSLQEAQLQWNSCHGALARQFAEVLPYEKYIQGHRMESNVVRLLKSIFDEEFENIDSIIGQAEAWLDRAVVPALVGPEIEYMMSMLLNDIDLFVDASSSHIFATKEHVILNRQVTTEPVPCLFNVD